MGVENRIKQQYGSAYWEKHKEEVVYRLQSVPQEAARVFGENSRSRRAERRAMQRDDTLEGIVACTNTLRFRDMTLQQISQRLGIPRSTLYRHRRGLVRRTSLLKETSN